MKTTKIFLIVLITGILAVTSNSCKKCKGENPRAKIMNNGTKKASVQIKTSDGKMVNINNADLGTSSAYKTYAAGQATFTIKMNNIDYVYIIEMRQCFDYDIAIDENNNITLQKAN